MGESETEADPTEHAGRSRSRLATVLWLLLAGVVALFGLSLAGAGDIIDLPEWANIEGVDVPLIGDTDQIDCRLEQVDDSRRVRITIVDGDEGSYAEYVHVWNNGNIVDPELVERLSDNEMISASKDGTNEQWYSISIEPDPDARVFCNMIELR